MVNLINHTIDSMLSPYKHFTPQWKHKVFVNKIINFISRPFSARSAAIVLRQGVLRIHVVEAKDLMKKDISVLGKGKSDPYAIISVGAQQFRTQTIDNTVNPKWDYWCEVSGHSDQMTATKFACLGLFVSRFFFWKRDTKKQRK